MLEMTGKDDYPYVSVVICSRDRHQLLEKAVESVLAADYPRDRYEIIVVEEGDTPSPVAQTNYVFLPRRDLGLGHARKRGVREAKGKFVVFTDDDCLAEKDWISKIIEPMLTDPDVFGVAGATLIKNAPTIGACEAVLGFPGGGYRRYLKAKGRIHETPFASGCNMAYRAAVFDKLEIDDKYYGRWGTDDTIISMQVAQKWKFMFTPHAIIYHLPRNSFSGIYKLFQRRRHKELIFSKKRADQLKEVFSLRRGMIPRLILAVLLVAALKWIGLVLALAGLMSLYLALPLRYASELKAAKARAGTYAALPLVKATMDISVLISDVSFLFSLVTGRDVTTDRNTLDKYYGRDDQ